MNASPINTAHVRIICRDQAVVCAREDAITFMGELLAKVPGATHADLKFEPVGAEAMTAPGPVTVEVTAAPKVNSNFQGGLVTDDEAKSRIEATQAALRAAGIKVDASHQLYATGTRMADVGYANQAQRAVEHESKLSIGECCAQLSERVEREGREDIEVSAHDFAQNLSVNGKVKAFGLAVTEQAMRGLCARLESPAIRYLLGMRDRIAETVSHLRSLEAVAAHARDAKWASQIAVCKASILADRAKIAEVISHECKQNPDVVLKLRARKNVGDIFATVSPGYEPADAPSVIGQVIAHLPADAKGTWSYDPTSTAWELRAHVWTKTPVAEQAVGEPFEGFASFQSRDNGTSRFRGGGGAIMLACLNAGTYMADSEGVSRVHRSNVLYNIEGMLGQALSACDIIANAWGKNRETVIEAPSTVKINDVIPGFWRYLLTDRRSELAGVLPGRSEKHVKTLTAAFHDERRDANRIVRSDLAQAWTRAIQDEEPPVRRSAEAAIGAWLVNGKKVGCLTNEEEVKG
jgi:hypothetical protein